MRLKELRLSQGLTIAKLSELSGVSKWCIREIEKKDDCRASKAFRLAEALGVTIDEFCKDQIVA